jgi:hypothetical protein
MRIFHISHNVKYQQFNYIYLLFHLLRDKNSQVTPAILHYTCSSLRLPYFSFSFCFCQKTRFIKCLVAFPKKMRVLF